MTNLINDITHRLEELNRSERKVADVILKDPDAATRCSIATLARSAKVSEPTVNRFCNRFTSSGFPDFKLQLALSMAKGTPWVSQSVDPDDSVEDFTDKIFQSTISALDSSRRAVPPKTFTKAIDYLSQAKQIAFFGLGGSAPVAMDAQQKFFRFNIPVVAHNDFLMQRMVAAASHTGDVIVFISYTGRTRELVEVAEIARKAGATVIGITAPDSPLSAQCTVALEVTAPENTDVFLPMTSRIVHLAIIDVLATGVTLRRGSDFQRHLRKIKESLNSSRVQEDSA
ncbi:MAG: transcriptional regulator HexR [Pseudomonadales bacterium]|nr:transcriptional regulator HexR [Pseudomonadales bacterium]